MMNDNMAIKAQSNMKQINSLKDSENSSPEVLIPGSTSAKHLINNVDIPSVYLVETFYISSKKNTVFQVRLTEKGLSLRKESEGTSKEQTIAVRDIIGCRCLRSKRKRNSTSACACTALSGQQNLRVVEENSVELDESDISAYLYIYAYILKKNRRNGKRERTIITLRFRSFDKYDDNNKEAQKWRAAIKQLIGEEIHSIGSANDFITHELSNFKDLRKVLIMLNPKSGSGKARETFQQRVAPIFVEAEIPYDLQVTKYANYAREFVRNKNIYLWRSIVVVGGDGICFEVLNGIFERSDWEQVLEEIPIGIIPCGSGNGLARTIAHVSNEPYDPKPVLGAALTAVRGKPVPMDLVRVETRSQIIFSFLSIGWGLISDIDIESERIRMIGYQRFTLWSFHRLISLRTYHGTVSYQPISLITQTKHIDNRESIIRRSNATISSQMRHSISCEAQLDCSECNGRGDCDACDTGFGDVLSLETTPDYVMTNATGSDSYRPRLDSWYSANSRKSTYYSTTESMYQSIAERLSNYDGSGIEGTKTSSQMYGPASTIPALTAPVPDSWIVETGEFIMVHASYQTHISSDCFFAPASQLNDGIIWLCIIKSGASRQDLFKFLLGLSTGTHIPTPTPSPAAQSSGSSSETSPMSPSSTTPPQHEFIKMIPVTAFRIEPQVDGTSEVNHGHFTVDGERVEYGPIQAEIIPGIAKIMAPIYPS